MVVNDLPILSIIVVAARDERLARTLESVNHESVEVVLVCPKNDAEAYRVFSAWKESFHGPTKLFHDEGLGIYDAMNLGAAGSTGKFILFLNCGDTLYRNDETNDFLSILNHYDSDWFIFQGSFNWREPQILNEANLRGFVLQKKAAYISHQTVVFKRKSFLELGLYANDLKVAADSEIIIKFALRGDPIFSPIVIAEVERPNFSAIHHRKARREMVRVLIRQLSGVQRRIAVSKHLQKELTYVLRKFIKLTK